ncbi:hypothetical protein [Pedobacter xixiisoli]|uniref:Uncharacterized protein n=1 Tax=Pedobacter xixiisoli TaxID=1476464 RepID=A0A285ZRH7_9SPHI|nr:hypothetical protein [Pedobacter xixiisoli]SOD12266.1 hypothetical protein SAMN06297358_0578 [Pedobacter xixiisoli]
MSNIRRTFKIAVKDDLLTLNGTEFEELCTTLLELILKEPVTLEGQNLSAKPVKYTGDMADIRFDIIGQCGTDENYFDDPFSKPLADLKGAIKNHPQCKEVYLFSNRFARTNRISSLTKEIENLKYSQKAYPYDADKIGDVIFDNLNSPKILKILSFLVRSNELYRLLPDANQIPKHKANYFNRDEETQIINRFKSQDVIQIYGLSGIGKSELSISIVEALKQEFEFTFFIEGDYEQNTRFKFEGVRLSKQDHLINLAGKLENSRVLLILDNFNQNVRQIVQDFKNLNKLNSKCLITSLEISLPKKEAFHLGYLNREQSEKILNSCSVPPNSSQLDVLLDFVGGYPLILNILKSNIDDGSFEWGDVINELGLIHSLSDPEMLNKNIASRIIGFVKDKFERQLAFVKYINPRNRKINKYFIKSMLGRLPLSDFEKSSLITAQDSIYFDIHQIVLDSINDVAKTTSFESDFDTLLLDFLNEQHQKKGVDFYGFIFNHRTFLDRKLSSATGLLKKSILYSLIQSNDINTSTSDTISKIKSIVPNGNDFIDILLLIEQFELELYLISETESRKITALSQIDALKTILSSVKEHNSQLALLHHIGKIYSKINENNLALDFFEKVLKIDPYADYTILQVTKIYSKARKTNEVKERLNFIFTNEEIRRKGSLTVLLAFYSLISDSNHNELRKEYIFNRIDDFIIEVKRCLDDKFDQPYEVLSKLSSSLCYEFPIQFGDLVESLPEPTNIDTNDKLRFNYAKILSEYYKFLYSNYTDDDKDIKLEKTKQKAINYFNQIVLDSFSRREAAKFFLLIEDFAGALALAKDFDFNDAFQYQTLCKIQRGLNNYDDSLTAIDKAIDMGKSKNLQSFFVAAFYNDKAETEYLLKSSDCIASLQQGIDLRANDQEKERWMKKNEAWKLEFEK